MKISSTEELMSASRKFIAAVDACDLVDATPAEDKQNAAHDAYKHFKSTFERVEKEISE